MAGTESVAQDQLKSFVRRIEATEDEIRALNADKSDIYKEAKANGFDVKVLRKVIAARRLDASERDEAEAIFDLYWSAIHGSERVVRAHVEIIEQFDPETGEIQSAATRPQAPVADAGEGGDAPSSPATQSVPAPPAQVAEAAPASGESAASREANMHVLPAANYLTPRGLIQLPSGLWRLPGCQGGDNCGSDQATKKRCAKCERDWQAQRHSEPAE